MTLARKGAKSRRRITSLRSKTTKVRTHADRLRAADADLKKKLTEALDQQAATAEILRIISTSPTKLFRSILRIFLSAVAGGRWVTSLAAYRSQRSVGPIMNPTIPCSTGVHSSLDPRDG